MDPYRTLANHSLLEKKVPRHRSKIFFSSPSTLELASRSSDLGFGVEVMGFRFEGSMFRL